MTWVDNDLTKLAGGTPVGSFVRAKTLCRQPRQHPFEDGGVVAGHIYRKAEPTVAARTVLKRG